MRYTIIILLFALFSCSDNQKNKAQNTYSSVVKNNFKYLDKIKFLELISTCKDSIQKSYQDKSINKRKSSKKYDLMFCDSIATYSIAYKHKESILDKRPFLPCSKLKIERIKNGKLEFGYWQCAGCEGVTYIEFRNKNKNLIMKRKFVYEGVLAVSEVFELEKIRNLDKTFVYEFDTLLKERVFIAELEFE